MYRLGGGVSQDFDRALAWFRIAAQKGAGVAQYNLGSMFLMGQGVAKNNEEAHFWFSLAAAQATDEVTRKQAARNLAMAAADMTPAQIAHAWRRAREWSPK